jgi:hypothetical protein
VCAAKRGSATREEATLPRRHRSATEAAEREGMGRRGRCLGLLVSLSLSSCATRVQRRIGPRLADIDRNAKVLVLHRRNGEAFVFDAWRVDTSVGSRPAIVGRAHRLGPDRQPVTARSWRVPMGSIALYETNVRSHSGFSVAMGLWSGLHGALYVAVAALLVLFASRS